MIGAGMAQGVWSVAWQVEVKRLQTNADHCSQTSNREGLKRWQQTEENLAPVCLWARLSEIEQDGFAHFPRQRVLMLAALLGAE